MLYKSVKRYVKVCYVIYHLTLRYDDVTLFYVLNTVECRIREKREKSSISSFSSFFFASKTFSRRPFKLFSFSKASEPLIYHQYTQ